MPRTRKMTRTRKTKPARTFKYKGGNLSLFNKLINKLKRNPSKALQNSSLIKTLQKNPSIIKELKNNPSKALQKYPDLAKKLKELQKYPDVSKYLKTLLGIAGIAAVVAAVRHWSLHRERKQAEQHRAAEQQRQAKQIEDTKNLVSAYCSFFEHISLRKGWKTVPFTQEGLKPLFLRIAKIVVAIRTDLDQVSPGFKMRMVDGSAREYMWTVTSDPAADDKQSSEFIRAMVHETFKDASGYVEGLTKAYVDKRVTDALELDSHTL